MKTVKAFQTSDGRIHTSEIGALKAEFLIELRGAIQSGIPSPRGDTVLIVDVCEAISRNPEKFANIIASNRRKISGALSRINRKNAGIMLTIA